MLESNGREVNERRNYHMSVEELEVLLNYLKKHCNKQQQIIVLIQAFMGLRASETVAINVIDFSENYTRLTYRAAKTNEVRHNEPVPEALAMAIREYVLLNRHRLIDGWLFPNTKHPDKGHITPAAYQASFAKWRKNIGKVLPKFLDTYSINVWSACSCGVTATGGWTALEKKKCRENGLKCFRCNADIREAFQIRYRIGTHSLRRLHRTFLKNNIEDLYLVKELCNYKSWESFQRYINHQEIHDKKHNVINNVFNPVISRILN